MTLTDNPNTDRRFLSALLRSEEELRMHARRLGNIATDTPGERRHLVEGGEGEVALRDVYLEAARALETTRLEYIAGLLLVTNATILIDNADCSAAEKGRAYKLVQVVGDLLTAEQALPDPHARRGVAILRRYQTGRLRRILQRINGGADVDLGAGVDEAGRVGAFIDEAE